MCGRAACGLDPDAICHACTYKNRDGKKSKPRWRDPPNGQKYWPSYNMAPGSHLPVLLSKKHVESESPMDTESPGEDSDSVESDWIVQPMRWGLIPSWHKGDTKGVGYNMINARSDGMLSKNTFRTPLMKGRRCVILVEGYFEWQTKDGKKQPYFIHVPRGTATKLEDVKEAIKMEQPDDGEGHGQLMTLAGLFDIWRPKNGDPPTYSHSIITVDAHKAVDWIHNRMPAVLNGEDEVRSWLDFGEVPLEKAVKLIRPVGDVESHPVSTVVNKAQEKGIECIKPIDLEKVKETASSKMMAAWLGKAAKKPVKRSSPPPEVKLEDQEVKEEDEPAAKKVKAETD